MNESAEKRKKQYLYHMVPQDMRGTILHPLNDLQDRYPDLYASESAKYEGRPEVLEQLIPTLQAKWNDVLQFSPVHPADIKAALIDAGLNPRQMRFFEVDPELLDPAHTSIYLFNNTDPNEALDVHHFASFDPDTIATHSSLPESTKRYYKKIAETGGKPLLFIGIPHVLHRGSLDVSGLTVIEV